MDLTPDNIVFRDGEAAALIDFDMARPASRVDEIHNAMLYWAPLGDPKDADPPLHDVDVPVDAGSSPTRTACRIWTGPVSSRWPSCERGDRGSR